MIIKSHQTKKTLAQLEAISGEKLTLGRLLYAIRRGEELTQTEFAKMLGVSRQYMCDIEHRRRNVSPKAAFEYAKILGYSPEQFVLLALQDQLDSSNLPYIVELRNAA